MTVNELLAFFGNKFSFGGRGFTGDDHSAAGSSLHSGIDFPAVKGTPVKALASGTVIYSQNSANDPGAAAAHAVGGGNVVNIKDLNGIFQYAHLDSISVQSGATVRRGDVIGTVGNTGPFVSGPHLHLGRKEGDKWIDPLEATIPPGSSNNPWVKLFLDILGKPADYILTQADVDRVVTYLVEVNPPSPFNDYKTPDESSNYYHGIFDKFVGKPVSAIDGSVKDLPSYGEAVGSSVGAETDAIGKLGLDLSSALMFLAIILIGIVFIGSGAIISLRRASA